jgi:hypothetical protein
MSRNIPIVLCETVQQFLGRWAIDVPTRAIYCRLVIFASKLSRNCLSGGDRTRLRMTRISGVAGSHIEGT